ncbi:MAG: septation protein SepH [Bifidobacterium sp.]|nr:septation protein SepH [Bifidobacterium sp.]
MAAENYPKARFESVTGSGALVFTAGDQHFVVEVDDRLEHAMLEAKQVQAERRIEEAPKPARTLPISQIQSLIRAGADPEQVAQRYGLSLALVHRFSDAVESEKSYAIEQFLRVPAPKEGKETKVRALAEVIDRTLAAARIPRESVTWSATRRGLEPWCITASFTSAGHPIHAEWQWNMRDNSVVCINNAARKLIGEGGLPQDGPLDDAIGGTGALPGESVRSARIEMTMAGWKQGQAEEEEQPRDEAADPTVIDRMALKVAPAPTAHGNGPAAAYSTATPAPSAAATPVAEGHHVPTPKDVHATIHPVQAAAKDDAAADAKDATQEKPAKDDAKNAAAQPQPETPTTASSAHPQSHTTRGHRPPVPTWDEIMFGKAPKEH